MLSGSETGHSVEWGWTVGGGLQKAQCRVWTGESAPLPGATSPKGYRFSRKA